MNNKTMKFVSHSTTAPNGPYLTYWTRPIYFNTTQTYQKKCHKFPM